MSDRPDRSSASANPNPIPDLDPLTEEPPVLVRVSDLLVLSPILTFPKAKLEGFGESVPWAAAVPVPDRSRVTDPGTWSEVVVKVTLPGKLPLLGGANVMLAEAVSPACRVSGRERLPSV